MKPRLIAAVAMILGVVALVGLVLIQQAQLIDRPQVTAAITSYVHTLATAVTRAGAVPAGAAPTVPVSVPVTAEASQELAGDLATLRAFRQWRLSNQLPDYDRATMTVSLKGALPAGPNTWRVSTQVSEHLFWHNPEPDAPAAESAIIDRTFLVTNVDGRWLVAKEEPVDPPIAELSTLDFPRTPLGQRSGVDWQAELATQRR